MAAFELLPVLFKPVPDKVVDRGKEGRREGGKEGRREGGKACGSCSRCFSLGVQRESVRVSWAGCSQPVRPSVLCR